MEEAKAPKKDSTTTKQSRKPELTPYDYEREPVPRKIFFKSQRLEFAREKLKKRILDAWKYFESIKNLPLSFVVRNSTKMVFLNEYFVAERESADLKLLKKIEKIRKKGLLIREAWVDQKGPCFDRFRRNLFKRRKFVFSEKMNDQTPTFRKHSEFLKYIQKHPLKRKKELGKKDVSVHSSQSNLVNKLPADLKNLITPVDFLNFKGKCSSNEKKSASSQEHSSQNLSPAIREANEVDESLLSNLIQTKNTEN